MGADSAEVKAQQATSVMVNTANNTTSLPSPPFIHAPGIANLRDAGGYALSHQPGKAIRRGILYRAADPTRLEPEGVAVLQGLGVTHIFDLRSQKELDSGVEQPKEWEGAKRVFVPVFLDKDYSPAALADRFGLYSSGREGFVQAYASILEGAAIPDHPYLPFQTILNHLASPAGLPSPILVHCSAGKDRTGIIIAIILSLCGVADDVVAHEYSLTELGLANVRNHTIERLVASPWLGGDRKKAEVMVSAKAEYLLATLSHIRAAYGSVESYVVKNLGVPASTVAKVRENLIVDDDKMGNDNNLNNLNNNNSNSNSNNNNNNPGFGGGSNL